MTMLSRVMGLVYRDVTRGGRCEAKVMEGGLVLQHMADLITGGRVMGGLLVGASTIMMIVVLDP